MTTMTLEELDGLYRTAVALTVEQDRAERLVLEACEEALRSDPGTADPRLWPYRVLVERWQRDRKPFDAAAVLPARDGATQVVKAMSALCPEMRLYLYLSCVAEFPYADIGAITGLPRDIVAFKVGRARRALRTAMPAQ